MGVTQSFWVVFTRKLEVLAILNLKEGLKKFPLFQGDGGGGGGGGHNKFYPVLRGGGGEKSFDPRFSHL